MPNVRISDLPLAALPLTGAELMEVTQGGLSKQVTTMEVSGVVAPTASLILTNSNIPDLVDTDVPLNVGALDPNIALHVEVGPQQVQAKADATTAAPLFLNILGDVVHLGGGGFSRLVTAISGAVEIRSDGLGDPNIGTPIIAHLNFLSSDQNQYAQLGFNNAATLRLVNRVQAGLVQINGTNTALAARVGIEFNPDAGVSLRHDGTATAATVSLAGGGFQINNTVTGGGFERALTTSDLAGAGGVTVEDEGVPLATVADTLDFVGAGVVASGVGTTKTITIAGGGGSLAALTDVDLSGQAQYDLLFNVDGVNWEDSAGNVILDTAALALQLAAGYAINMGATPLRVLEMAASGSPSVTVDHPSVQVVAEQSTVSNTEVDVPGGIMPAMIDGDTYLIFAVAQHHQGNTGGENVTGASCNVASASGVPLSGMREEIEPPAAAVASNQGAWFSGMNCLNPYSVATHGLLRFEHAAGAGQTHYVNNANCMAMNLTQFGAEGVDWFRSITVPFITVTDAGWSNAPGSITIGDGVSDWLIIFGLQMDQPIPNPAANIQYGLFDGSVNTQYGAHEFENIQDVKSVAHAIVLTGIPSTTFQVAMRAAAASGDGARFFYAGITAIRLNKFAQYSINSATGPTSPGGAAEFSLLTDSIVASGSSDWGIIGAVVNRWIANTISGTSFVDAQVNGGGFATVSGFEAPDPQAVVEDANFDETSRLLIPVADITGIVATDTIDNRLRWIPPSNFGPTRAQFYSTAMFTWDTLDTSVNATTLGDPTVDTQIDGLGLSIAGAYTLPVLDGTIGQSLQTDGAGAVTFGSSAIPDPLIIGSINCTSSGAVNDLGAPYTNVALNIGANLVGTQGMVQYGRQNIQARPSGFGFNSTLFININGTGTNGANTFIGGLNGAGIEIDFGVEVNLRHGLVSTTVAQTAAPAAGGLLANNLATGAGLERVLTTADLGGAPVTQLVDGGANIRISAETLGIAQLRSVANTDAEGRTLRFTHQNGTIRAEVGYASGSGVFEITQRVHGQNIQIRAETIGGVERLIGEYNADGSGASGVGVFTVWDNAGFFPWLLVIEPGSFATRSMSSVQYMDALGVQRPAGPATSTPVLFAGNVTLSINDFQVHTRYHDEGITRIFDIPVTLTTVANGSMLAIVNLGLGGTQLRPATGVSIEWWDGAAYQTLVGNGALVITLPTGRFSLWKIGDALYEVVGPGIS